MTHHNTFEVLLPMIQGHPISPHLLKFHSTSQYGHTGDKALTYGPSGTFIQTIAIGDRQSREELPCQGWSLSCPGIPAFNGRNRTLLLIPRLAPPSCAHLLSLLPASVLQGPLAALPGETSTVDHPFLLVFF
jgi:hypothetical protein